MKLNIEPIKSWFGFTRRERRASFILLLLVIMVLVIRNTVPEKNIEIEEITSSVPETGGATVERVYGIEEERSGQVISSVEVKTDTSKKSKTNSYPKHRSLIDLNRSDTTLLITLPGIGPVLSLRIIKYRNLLGGFVSVNQLREVYGLPPATFELIKGRVFADSSYVIRIKINSAGYKELVRLPYFEKSEVISILKYRELKGRIRGINDLIDNNLISLQKSNRVRPYLDFE